MLNVHRYFLLISPFSLIRVFEIQAYNIRGFLFSNLVVDSVLKHKKHKLKMELTVKQHSSCMVSGLN